VTWGIPASYWRTPTRYLVEELIVRPFATLITPWRDSVLTVHPAIGFIGGTLVLVPLVVSLLIWTRRDGRFHSVSRMALWVLAAGAPVYAYLLITGELEGSRYVYQSAAGWMVLLVSMIAPSPWALRSPIWHRTVLGIAAIVILAWGASLRQEIGVWRQAAQLRDEVLRSAGTVAKAAGCSRIALADAPDSLAGPFVFRNGLAEALVLNGLPSLTAASAVSPPCRFRWSGGRFVPDPGGTMWSAPRAGYGIRTAENPPLIAIECGPADSARICSDEGVVVVGQEMVEEDVLPRCRSTTGLLGILRIG
jgi:hypothetical protein